MGRHGRMCQGGGPRWRRPVGTARQRGRPAAPRPWRGSCAAPVLRRTIATMASRGEGAGASGWRPAGTLPTVPGRRPRPAWRRSCHGDGDMPRRLPQAAPLAAGGPPAASARPRAADTKVRHRSGAGPARGPSLRRPCRPRRMRRANRRRMAARRPGRTATVAFVRTTRWSGPAAGPAGGAAARRGAQIQLFHPAKLSHDPARERLEFHDNVRDCLGKSGASGGK